MLLCLLLENDLCAPTIGGPLELDEVRCSGRLCSHYVLLMLCQPEPLTLCAAAVADTQVSV
jgi:hypothetical protein